MDYQPEFNSPTWIWLKDELKKEIEKGLCILETHGLSDVDTEYHRGIIKAYRHILKKEPTNR